ncbi:MAG TPA: hypothetical protein VN476_17850, partial [Pyrinomonadaceae bacterium]|nr:hypothetical protein [Pyrinomonadaceae bacterium]
MKTFRPLIRQRMLSAHTWRTSLNGICLLATMMLAPITGSAAGGDIDPSFNPGAGASGSTATVLAVAVQTDGKIVVGGTFSQAAGQARGNIARFNPDGSLDPTFLSSGVGANGDVSALFVQPDGKIVICGDFTTVNGSARNRIARLNSDGTLDFTFLATGSGANFVVNAAALQSDGKIVIGGRFTTINGTTRNHIARINSDGTLDASFLAAGSGINGDVFSLALQTDGKTLIGGFFTSVNGTARNGIARLNSDGTNDASFLATGSGVNNSVFAVAVQSDDRVVIGGLFTNVNGIERNGAARLNPDGNLDMSFLAAGSGANAPLYAIALQSDGKIVIGGAFTNFSGTARDGIERLNANGSVDTSFLVSGSGANNIVRCLALQSDGKILLGGAFTTVNGTVRTGIARLDNVGNLDNAGTGVARNDVTAVALQSDGRILIGGSFTTFSGTARNRIARLNSDGTLDTTFLAAGAGANGDVSAVTLQGDGKILIGGNFTSVNGTARNRIARLNSDGTLDTAFLAAGSGADSSVRKIAIQADNRILVGGSFANINGTARNSVARLNADGSLDNSFLASGAGANGPVFTLAVQSDGKILIGGDFTSFNGTSRNRFARLNSDGTLDTTFLSTGTGANDQVLALALQSDGKVLIGGAFTSVNNATRNRLARLNTDGTLDTAFLANAAGANYSVRAIAVQSDGWIVIGGDFGNYNGAYRGNIARLRPDSSLDETFVNFNSGANSRVSALALQTDGKVIVGGFFSTVNDAVRGGIARLITNPAPNPIDTAANLVIQHYRDFLSREPDPDGLAFWTGQITSCGANAQCIEVARVNVSASFFLSIEFQQTGYLVERMYKSAYGDATATSTFPSTHQLAVPIVRFDEFLRDTQRIGQGVIVLAPGWEQLLESNKQAYATEFVQTPRFSAAFPTIMPPEQFVDKLSQNAGNVLSATERTTAINLFDGTRTSNNTTARAQALRQVAEDTDL